MLRRLPTAALNARSITLSVFTLLLTLLANTASAASLTLTWDKVTASNLAGYHLYYGTASRSYNPVPLDAGTATTKVVTGLTPGQTYYFSAKSYAANGAESAYSNEVKATVPGATTSTPPPPTANFSATPSVGTAPLPVQFTDRSTGQVTKWLWEFGDNTSSPLQNPKHSYNAAGKYDVSLTVTGPGGSKTLTLENFVTVNAPAVSGGTGTGTGTVNLGSTLATLKAVPGLVAAYRFDEPSGPRNADSSGKGNHGTRKETIVVKGKYGRALSFDGVNDWLTVDDDKYGSLDLTNAMTLEAWVFPTRTLSQWRSIILKETSGNAVYSLYANSDVNAPSGVVDAGGEKILRGTSALPTNQWSHLASTYDGSTLRVYVNGTQVSSRPVSGRIATSDGKLRIGGNSVWNEFFSGRVDEVRIYNRALSNTEIRSDMATPIWTTNPPALLAGDMGVSKTAETVGQGVANAFRVTARAKGLHNRLGVFLDSATTASSVVIGLYSDAGGHPGQLLATGRWNAIKRNAWNAITTSAAPISDGQAVWIAVLGTNGNVVLRNGTSASGTPSETNSSRGLTALPANWGTGTRGTGGPNAAYSAGY